MSYVPPHLTPTSIQAPKVVNMTGKLHWPTNLNSTKENNVVQPTTLSKPVATTETLGIDRPKTRPIVKLVQPITPNTAPVVRPTMSIKNLPPIFRKAVRRHVKYNKTKRRSKAKSQIRHTKKHRALKPKSK